MGHSAGGAFHPDPARPGFRSRGCRHQLGAHGGRQGDSALGDQVEFPHLEEPGEPAPGCGVHRRDSGTTYSQIRSVRTSRWRSTSATTSPLPARSSGGALLRTSIRARTTPTSITTTMPGHRCYSWRGGEDHLFPLKVPHLNAKHDKSKTVTEVVEFDGPHLLPAIPQLAGSRGRRS